MTVTKVIKIDPLHPQEELVRFAGETIKRGGLVIIPTETVYGIAGNLSDPRAMARLIAIKDRPDNKPFSLHIDSVERIEQYCIDIPISAYKLASKFWPGPLTMVLKSKSGSTIGLRVPDNEIALEVIAASGVPVVCPSANLAGRPSPRNLEDALIDLNGKVDLAIDGSNAKLGVESTVVDLSVTPLQVLREGAIKTNDIERVASLKTVLFVCTGNSCRSVMAKAYLDKRLKENKRNDIEVLSAGIMMMSGMGATEETKAVLKEEGIDVSDHHSQRISEDMLRRSDIILVMEKLHEVRILQMAPIVKNRLFLLNEFAKIKSESLDITDPIGGSHEVYLKTFGVIKEAIERIISII